MNKFRKIALASAFLASLGLASCKKDFLDVNQNPNIPLTNSPDLALPSGILAAAYTMGNQFQLIGGFWAQYWTQSLVANQYKQFDRYNVGQNDFDRPWQYLYSTTLSDLQFVRTKASGDSVNYAAIAGLMQAYTYQVLVDGYDKIPFTQALLGLGNTAPAYDEGSVVYDGLIQLIDESLAKINDQPRVQIGTEDLVFKGNMAAWRRFGNTLKLKIYLRQIYARPAIAEAGIRQLYSSGAQFLSGAENAQVAFVNSDRGRNPLYETELGASSIKNNIIASETSIQWLDSTADPRIEVLYNRPASSPTGPFVGEIQGQAALPGPGTPIEAYSRPGPRVLGPTTPVPFITGYESLFLQAEAAARGLGTGDARALYAAGIQASFDYLGATMDADYLTQPAVDFTTATDLESKLERIITQKWVAMNGTQGFEAWTELRRTGYPSFIEPSVSSVLPAGIIANRLPYPLSESQRNPNAPGLVRVEVPVWWDKRN